MTLLAQAPDLTPVIPPPAPPPRKQKVELPATVGKDEITARDAPALFKIRVNYVLVPVVVRDATGKAIWNLTKEDFRLTDNGKIQKISSFAVESRTPYVAVETTNAGQTKGEAVVTRGVQPPQRFVALFFDDLHLAAQDVMVSRQAATKLIAALRPTDRISVFTTSGQVELDFTSERQRLEEALQRIGPRGVTVHSPTDCPAISFYEAYSIIEVRDKLALQVAIQNAVACGVSSEVAEVVVLSAAQKELAIGETELQFVFSNLALLIRRMSALPGERSIVLISPGFFMTPSMRESKDMIDHAVREGIAINTIDARGLYVSAADAGLSTSGRCPTAECQSFVRQEEMLQDDVLAELSDGTGGLFIHNRNDIDQGLLQAATGPEVSYVLGFSPQSLNLDGKYHHLNVSLTRRKKFVLQARHGYFAPSEKVEHAVATHDEIQKAIYTGEELIGLPIDCETQFLKKGLAVHLSVVARIDVRGLTFRKAEGRNIDRLTVATAVFDDNGNLVAGLQRVIDMRLKDATLERLNKAGIGVSLDFTVKPGAYRVRLVVQDSEGAQMTAINRGVVIPR